MSIRASIGKIFTGFSRLSEYFKKAYLLSQVKEKGKDVHLGTRCELTPSTLIIGNNVSIGTGCVFKSAHGEIKIGNHVMFGPGVHIHGGNHIMSEIGVYMDEVKKEPGQDGKVVIEDDTWIGANSIILGGRNGIIIGRGSVIGAGSVVTKDVPPYSVSVGNPARVIHMRFDDETIRKHETALAERNN